MGGIAEIARLDEALAALANGEAGLRLRIAQALEVMSRGAVFELGFSSLGAYAVERCERGVRWAEAGRCMARRLEQLPALRQGVATGRVSWSMAELLARVAQPEDEASWMGLAAGRTVRQMRVLVTEAGPVPGGIAPLGESDAGCSVQEDMCFLSCTVDQEEGWLFEATRSLLDQLGAHGADAQCEALLAEGLAALLRRSPNLAFELERLHASDGARERWLEQVGRWRAEAERVCEKNAWRLSARAGIVDADPGSVAAAAALGMASLEGLRAVRLDAQVRALACALARHELELARLLLMFHRADGWRRLGYASETQYARERLGASRSSVVARRALAQRVEALPGVAAALGAGTIGIEAALQIVRVATPKTEAAWIARARRRTIKHLREEVAAALTAVRWSGEADCSPPVDAELEAFQALEQAVLSGRVGRELATAAGLGPTSSGSPSASMSHLEEPSSEERRAWFVMLASLAAWLDGGHGSGVQMSAGRFSARGRVTIRLRVSRAVGVWWRALEALARDRLPRGMSWLRFLCLSLWDAWRHLFGAEVAYGRVYVRDRYRCTNPVCCRRDVTPHHLQFRSAGGSDEDINITTICSWCHLCGIHGGRIRARGTADHIVWELGAPRAVCLVVDGRERL